MATATVNIPTQVSNHANLAAFPVTGALKTLYIAEDTEKLYRWTGSIYVEVSSGSASTTWGGITGTLSNQTDLQTALDGKVDENAAITGATKTKITYDPKGLVTSGTDATTADIADSTNKRYVTDAQLTVISNTSGTNTGDETAARIGAIVNGATNYPTPLDADKIGIWDVANSLFKALTWANLKATLKTYFDGLYSKVAIFRYDSSTSVITSPGDGGIFYSGTINNYAPETGTTYRFVSPANNTKFLVFMNTFVRGTLASSELTTIKLQNITAVTEETIGTITSSKRINSTKCTESTLANAAGDEMIIQCTNPTWVTNPTTVHYQWIIMGYAN